MSEGLECSECKGMYHHTTKCSLKGVPLPVWPLHTQAEVDALLLTHTEAMVKAVEGLRQNSHIHHGSYVQGHNHAIDKSISAIRKAGKNVR